MKKDFKKFDTSKTIILVNPVNNENWYCDDYNNVKLIEGEEFVVVYKIDSSHRTFLMRKDALKVFKGFGNGKLF
jgi:hypothetical protein